MPKAFTEEEKNHIRHRLLDEGAQRFANYGLRKTNVEELASAAGISKGAFYLFFESKEALFMDVAEEAEIQFRREVLATVAEPGPSPRARLVSVLSRAYRLWRDVPVLRFFAHDEYQQIVRRVSHEIFEEHAQSDDAFMAELIEACRAEGIPVQITARELRALSMPLFFTSFHETDPLPLIVPGTMEVLIELVAAYCLGEIELETSLFGASFKSAMEN